MGREISSTPSHSTPWHHQARTVTMANAAPCDHGHHHQQDPPKELPPNHPLTDPSPWPLATTGSDPWTRALNSITRTFETIQTITNQWPTCPLDGQLCGQPCCPIATLRDH